jgi:uncharacterized protein (DUF2345 family)
MSTWPHAHPGSPAGDLAPGMALLKQADTLAQTLSQAAGTHQTVKLSVAIGSTGQNQSRIDDQAAPHQALHKVSSGMVDARDEQQAQADASQKNTTTGQDKVPHLTDPALIQAAKADCGTIAGQHLHYTNGETTTFETGQDSNLAIAGKTRIHAGQAIGLLAGAIKPGEGNTGIRLIAARDDIDLQAQSDEMKFQAKQEMKLVSANAHIDFAAAKKVHLAVQGGASITIDGGITVQCPGTITVHASKKKFSGPAQMSHSLPQFPYGVMRDAYSNRLDVYGLFAPQDFQSISYTAKFSNGRISGGALDEHGRSAQIYTGSGDKVEVLAGPSQDEWDLIFDYDEI